MHAYLAMYILFCMSLNFLFFAESEGASLTFATENITILEQAFINAKNGYNKQSHILKSCMRSNKLIGASLSEPHINGTAVRELYIYILLLLLLWYVGHAKYMPSMALWT